MTSPCPEPLPTSKTRSWVALGMSVVPGLSVVGFFLGRSVLRRSRLGRDFGRRQALVAVAIGSAWFAVGAVVLAVMAVRFVSSPAVRPSTDQAQTIDVTDLALGDCLRDVASAGGVFQVTVVPCDEPHHGEIYATFELRGETHQSNDKAAAVATRGCSKRLPADLTNGLPDATLNFIYPYGSAMFASDKTVRCVVETPEAREGAFGQDVG